VTVIRRFSRAESPANPPVVQLAHDRFWHEREVPTLTTNVEAPQRDASVK
jgi:hypothetical protein